MAVRSVPLFLVASVVQFQYISCVGSMMAREFGLNNDLQFQYISCVGSILISSTSSKVIHISIHLMCRFDGTFPDRMYLAFLYFNTSHVSVRSSFSDVSWQNTADFNTSHVSVRYINNVILPFIKSFQYISCVGSIIQYLLSEDSLLQFQYISCVGSILLEP